MTENKIYEKGSFGWLREQAKKDGFDNIRDWQNWKRYQNIKNIDQVEKILKTNSIYIKDIELFYRFWSNVNIKNNNEECWNWIGYISPNGYGMFFYNFGPVLAHRVVYKLSKSDIYDNLQVKHLCNNRKCCNPNHLELGDDLKNSQYMVKCGRHIGNNKLTEDQVREIHKLYNEQRKLYSNIKQQQIVEPIAKKFEISKPTITSIINGNRWKHIYDEFTKN